MREPIKEGWFRPSSESVGLRGDRKPLSWGKTFRATDVDGDSLYQLMLTFQFEQDSLTIACKIKVDGADNPNDGWQTGQNHQVTIYRDHDNRFTLAWTDPGIPTAVYDYRPG